MPSWHGRAELARTTPHVGPIAQEKMGADPRQLCQSSRARSTSAEITSSSRGPEVNQPFVAIDLVHHDVQPAIEGVALLPLATDERTSIARW